MGRGDGDNMMGDGERSSAHFFLELSISLLSPSLTSKILTMASTEANELKAQGNEAFRKVSGYNNYIVRQNKQ